MPDNLGIFDPHPDDDTGEVDVSELREALSRRAASTDRAAPARATVAPSPQISRASERKQREIAQRRRHRRRVRSSIIALIVLALIAGGVVVGVTHLAAQGTDAVRFRGHR